MVCNLHLTGVHERHKEIIKNGQLIVTGQAATHKHVTRPMDGRGDVLELNFMD
jgi:hypothetical protein